MKYQWEERDYSILEFALSCVNWVRESKVQSGDIVTCRPPLGHIGWKEAKIFLWVPIEGIEKTAYHLFRQPIIQNDKPIEKRRYCIPLHRLNQIYSINLEKVVDVEDNYQPFYQLDLDTYQFIITNAIPYCSGLIFDKVTGLYL